jgi:hypothetical protein
MADTPGRNDPCPCGSGEKYKHCCMNESAWYENKLLSGALIALVLVTGLVLIGMMFFGGGPDCPPGQVWSQAHGHCH